MEKSVEKLVENSGKTPANQEQFPLESLHVGQEYRSEAFAFDGDKIQQFAEISGDRNPIHLDPDFARRTIYRGVIAHGQLVAAIAAGLAFSTGIMGKNILALESTHEQFFQPVRPGDQIYGTTRIDSVDPSAARRCGRVVWVTRIFKVRENGDSVLAMEARMSTLVFKKAYMPK